MSEHDLTEDDAVLYANMREEWLDIARKRGVSEEAFRAAMLALMEVIHPIVTEPPPVFVQTQALLGAQAVYAVLIRGMYGDEYGAWKGLN